MWPMLLMRTMTDTSSFSGPQLPTAARLFEKLPRFLRRHRLMRWWMALTGEEPVQLVRIRGDAFGYADMGDGFLRLIVIDRDFELDFFALAESFLENGGVFLDVGANYGLLSLGLAATHAERVDFHLFEPNPKLVAAIERSIALYPRMRYTLTHAAVADREGVVPFFFDEQQSGTSHISEDGENSVASITLDHYLERAQISRVELLKIDVEGYELVALRGAQHSLETKAIQAIYFEYCEKWLIRAQPPRELLEYLEASGYEVCFCRPDNLRSYGGPTHTIRHGLAGRGVSLLPVHGHSLPAMTDLLAVPRENLVMNKGGSRKQKVETR